MPAHVPPSKPDPEPEVSIEQMVQIREDVKQKLIRDYHSHRLTARLYRNIGKSDLAAIEEATMSNLKRMIADLSEEEIEHTTRLLEGLDDS